MGVLAAGLLAVGMGTTASALYYKGSQYGSTIHTSGTIISLTDSYGDNKFPAVNYKYAGGTKQGGFSKNGYGTTVTAYASSTITAIQPCISRPAPLPLNCSNWIY